jgi:hypothetical protein
MKDKLHKVKETTEKQIKKGIQKTRELKFYLFKFACRIAVFIAVLVLYLSDREWLEKLMTQPIRHGFTLVHFVWLLFMGIMISHLIPNNRLTMAWKKARESEYRPVEHYDELELLKYVQKQNVEFVKAFLSMARLKIQEELIFQKEALRITLNTLNGEVEVKRIKNEFRKSIQNPKNLAKLRR